MARRIEVRRQMFSMISAWEESKLSQQAWCDAHGISLVKFKYWIRKYRMADGSVRSGNAFIGIEVSHPNEQACAEVIYPDGRRIVLHQPVGATYLKSLMA